MKYCRYVVIRYIPVIITFIKFTIRYMAYDSKCKSMGEEDRENYHNNGISQSYYVCLTLRENSALQLYIADNRSAQTDLQHLSTFTKWYTFFIGTMFYLF